MKLNFSWVACIISRLGSGHWKYPSKEIIMFWKLQILIWGLLLREEIPVVRVWPWQRGWGGVGPLWFNHFLEDPKQSQTLIRPWSGSVWAQTSPWKLWVWPSVCGPSWGGEGGGAGLPSAPPGACWAWLHLARVKTPSAEDWELGCSGGKVQGGQPENWHRKNYLGPVK